MSAYQTGHPTFRFKHKSVIKGRKRIMDKEIRKARRYAL
jgi:hypothetical protein